jgi:hypothetical protein
LLMYIWEAGAQALGMALDCGDNVNLRKVLENTYTQ